MPGTYLHSVVGRSAAKAQATDDLDAVLSNPTVDAVYIAAPHAQHGDFIHPALAGGSLLDLGIYNLALSHCTSRPMQCW